MDDLNTPPPIHGTTAVAPKRRGCLFYGCLTCIILLLMLFLAGFLAVRYVKNRINAYTDSEPMKLAKVEMSDADYKQLEVRAKAFGEAMNEGKPVDPLVLTETDINALVFRSGDTKQLADKVHVSLKDSNVTGQVSIPLSGLGWIGKGRYLNGEATFNVSLESGVLIVTAREVRVKGKPLPETFMKQVRRENLAKDAYKDADNAKTLRKIESIQIEDGKVIIKSHVVPKPQAYNRGRRLAIWDEAAMHAMRVT